MTDSFKRDMSMAAGSMGLRLDDGTLRLLYKYFEMLVERNNYVNLTAITDEPGVITRHFLDSLAILRAVEPGELDGIKLIDIGTGAGFPGMVLKIVFPGLFVTLVEATGKKADFLRDVSGELGLTGIEIVKARAEDLGRDESYREGFDIATARAVASLDTLSEYALCFVRVGGRFVAYKGKKSREELKAAAKAIETMGGGNEKEYEYSLPGENAGRSPWGGELIVIEKLSPTPPRYPRRAGVPSARPIGR